MAWWRVRYFGIVRVGVHWIYWMYWFGIVAMGNIAISAEEFQSFKDANGVALTS